MNAATSALLILLVALVLPAQAAEPPFETVRTEYQTVPRERVFDAVVEAIHRSTVSAQASGRVIEVLFDVDDFVEQGSVILRLRDREQRSALEAAQASLGEAQAREREAAAEHTRVASLFDRGLVARAALDAAEADFRAAERRLEAAQARVDQAREQLEHTVVRAPFSGIVVERHIEPGETATPGQPLLTGVSLDQLRVSAHVAQDVIGTIRARQEARVMLAGAEGPLEVPGERLTISPYADPASHTFRIRVDLPKEVPGVYPGMFGKVAFVVGEERRLVVPREAVVQRGEVTGVYVLREDGSVALRHIRLGRALPEERVEVLAGLSEGEQVATDPIRAGAYLVERRAER
ncbi:efflux RND transporter periplasmic adaptor subunit [Ectothiorhodospiraceae bacterium 2226]|nr:efflux RND transporter periplasmic adaptor subunit [Ectothiorhodospiraceae bacterium 2226]